MRLLALIAAAASVAGCIKSTPFACTDDAQCVDNGIDGRCEPTGFCSFPDDTCTDGFRYGEASGDLGNICVGEEPGADAGTGPIICLDVQQLALGGHHSCALTSDGDVFCWGLNSSGQIGDNTRESRSAPVEITTLNAIVELTAGSAHTCARVDNGFVSCWGEGGSGRLGNGSTSDSLVPTAVEQLTDAVQITAGESHTCARKADGTAVCWGDNGDSQLGNGDPGDLDSSIPVAVVDPADQTLQTPLANVLDISGGEGHTCAIVGTGVMCWGENFAGQLGDGTNTDSRVPVSVLGLSGTPQRITAGENHTCVLMDDNTAQCWGSNNEGQLGIGVVGTDSAVPVTVAGGFTITAIEAGEDHTCALDDAGNVYCWGDNGFGQLGNGGGPDTGAGAQVFSGVTVLGVGNNHVCAADAPGTITCWGRNDAGQLALNSQLSSDTPITVPAPVGTADSLVAGDDFNCALSSGAAHCWGANFSFQLGNNSTRPAAIPVAPDDGGSPLTNVTGLRAEHTIACALQGTEAKCWGQSDTDSTDSVNGSDNTIETPRVLVNTVPRPVIDMAIGPQNMWATTSVANEELWCWGDNAFHSCGIRGDTGELGAARQVDYFTTAAMISNGFSHTCALVGGVVQCIGSNNDAKLGDPAATSSDGLGTPVTALLPAGTVDALDAGNNHTCALIAGGVYCWGDNDEGQLGDGTQNDSDVTGSIAKALLPADDAIAIDTHDDYSCAIRSNDQLWCWGRNDGDKFATGGTDVTIDTPVQVPGLTVTDMGLGDDHICVIDSIDSSVKCWGSNLNGQIGLDRPFQMDDPTTTVLVCEP